MLYKGELVKNITFTANNFSLDLSWKLLQRSLPRGLKALLQDANLVAKEFFFTESFGVQYKSRAQQEISIALSVCGDTRMKSLNKGFRKLDKTTDVLSFPQYEDFTNLSDFGTLFLGDIIISYDVCLKQAKMHEIEVKQEFLHLFFHGFLHLLNYDHERSAKEAKIMFALEDKLVKKTLRRV